MNKTLSPPAEPLPPPTAVSSPAANANTRLRYAVYVAAVLVIVGAAAGLVPRWQRRVALRAETRELAVQTVSVACPAPSPAAAALALPAELRPFLESPIYARVNGYLKRWLVDIGAPVKAGDLLAEIETPELDQQLAQARAQLAEAQAALALARTTAARWAELLKTASVSEQDAAEKQADLELKSASVQAAQANVRRLEETQAFRSVKAPFAGTITARNTDLGELIAAGNGKELFRLAQTSTLRVYVRVPQTAAAAVAPGQKAEMVIPELPGRIFPAKVVRTSGAMSAESRTLLTELAVDNSRGEILAGSFAQVRFPETTLAAPLTLPANSLLFRSQGTQVGVVGADGKAVLRNVTLGRDFGPTIEILEGVSARDRVILNPADSLVSGTVVRVAEGPK
jgi:RND family efflux transporter MFP subunit